MQEWLALAERELRCPVVLSHEVKDGETHAVVGRVTNECGCLFLDDQVALIALDPCPDNMDGCVVAFGSATRRGGFLVGAGGRVLLDRQGKERAGTHGSNVEGWVLARSERRIDGRFWIRLSVTREDAEDAQGAKERSSKRSRVDHEDMWDVYDAEYGYDDEQQEEARDAMSDQQTVVVELQSDWSVCAPGTRVGLWAAQRVFQSCHVQMTAGGALFLSSSSELLDEFVYCGEVTSVVSPTHVVLDGDLACLLCVPRNDLVVGMQMQAWHAHPVWDGPALVLCPFSSLLVVGFTAGKRELCSKPSLPLSASSLPAWARVWLNQADLPTGQLQRRHACQALLLSLGARQPMSASSEWAGAEAFAPHSSQSCPYFDADDRVPAPAVVLDSLSVKPTAMAPFPFAYSGSGPFVMLRSTTEVMPIAMRPPPPHQSVPKSWMLCVMSSERDAVMLSVESGQYVFVSSPNRFHFVPRQLYCSVSRLPANAFPLPQDTVVLLEAQRNLLLGPPETCVCVCEVKSPGGSVFGVCDGKATLSCLANPARMLLLRTTIDLPVGPLQICNRAPDGSLTCFSDVRVLSDLPLCSGSIATAGGGETDVSVGRVVRMGEKSCMADNGAVVAKVLGCGAVRIGQLIRFRVTSVANSGVRSYRSTPQTLLAVLEALRRGKKPPPCPGTQHLATQIE